MGAEAADELLRTGREALAAADWETARSCFEKARELGDSAEVLDGLGQALHFQGEYDRAIELKERAFAAYRRVGRPVEAAELARRGTRGSLCARALIGGCGRHIR